MQLYIYRVAFFIPPSIGLGFDIGSISVICGKVVVEDEIFSFFSSLETAM